MTGTLYLVSTPIGNLEDITLRALRILKEVSAIACEDTRQTVKLLNHFLITTPTISYHEHNERERTPQLLARLAAGESLALVSDAGTPLLSDPGYILVRAAIAQKIDVVAVPGASALLTALVAAGLATREFYFAGFLPHKANERRKRLGELTKIAATLVFYESPHRIAHTLADLRDILGNREAVLARELTKLHEEFVRGPIDRLSEIVNSQSPRGEYVVVVAGHSQEAATTEKSLSISAEVEKLIETQGLDKMAALKALARTLGISKSEAYRRLQAEEAARK